jgi:hypothetical protein
MTADTIKTAKSYLYRPLDRLGQLTTLFLALAGLGGALVALAMVYQLVFLGRVQTGGFDVDVDIEQAADFNDQIVLVASIIHLFLFFVSGAFFLFWVYRAAANIHAFNPSAMSITPGWAVGWNFVPIASLWKPYQAVKQIWQSSQNISYPDSIRVPERFGWWWGFWLATNFVGGVADRTMESGIENEDIGVMKAGTGLGLADSIFFIMACFLLY